VPTPSGTFDREHYIAAALRAGATGFLFAKLGVRDRAQAVIAVYETGLVTRGAAGGAR
jgi:hypothetical protein